jgi:hypothetical protein
MKWVSGFGCQVSVLGFRVQRFRVKRFRSSEVLADSSQLIVRRIEGWEAGKLEGSEACEFPGFLASQFPSLKPMSYELSAMSYLPDTRHLK